MYENKEIIIIGTVATWQSLMKEVVFHSEILLSSRIHLPVKVTIFKICPSFPRNLYHNKAQMLTNCAVTVSITSTGVVAYVVFIIDD